MQIEGSNLWLRFSHSLKCCRKPNLSNADCEGNGYEQWEDEGGQHVHILVLCPPCTQHETAVLAFLCFLIEYMVARCCKAALASGRYIARLLSISKKTTLVSWQPFCWRLLYPRD